MKNQPNIEPLSEADEIEALLPWLATGKLAPSEAARVTRYLEANPVAASHLRLVREEMDSTISGNEAIAAPSFGSLDRLMASVAATPQPRVFTVPSPASVWEKIAGLITGIAPRNLGFAAAALALVLVAQSAVIGTLMNRDSGAYETASDGQTTAAAQALVSLQPGVTAQVLTAALTQTKAVIVDGPRAGGIYRLRTATDQADAAAIATLLKQLKERSDVFAFVGPVKP